MIGLWILLATALATPCDALLQQPPPQGETQSRVWARDKFQQAEAQRRLPASPGSVWAVITGFDRYVDFMPYVTSSRLVSHQLGVGTESWDVRYELTTRGVRTHYQLSLTRSQGAPVMRFSLRPSRWSPVRAIEGSWTVCPLGADEVVISYALAARPAWWAPARMVSLAGSQVARVVEVIGNEVRARQQEAAR